MNYLGAKRLEGGYMVYPSYRLIRVENNENEDFQWVWTALLA